MCCVDGRLWRRQTSGCKRSREEWMVPTYDPGNSPNATIIKAPFTTFEATGDLVDDCHQPTTGLTGKHVGIRSDSKSQVGGMSKAVRGWCRANLASVKSKRKKIHPGAHFVESTVRDGHRWPVERTDTTWLLIVHRNTDTSRLPPSHHDEVCTQHHRANRLASKMSHPAAKPSLGGRL